MSVWGVPINTVAGNSSGLHHNGRMLWYGVVWNSVVWYRKGRVGQHLGHIAHRIASHLIMIHDDTARHVTSHNITSHDITCM